MQPLDHRAEVCTEHLGQRPGIQRDNVNLQPSGAERGGDLKPNEARAHNHGPVRLLGLCNDGAALSKRAL